MEHSSDKTPRVGVFICHCGINIGGVVKVPEVVEYAKTLPDVVYAEGNLYTCSSEGLSKIKEGIQKYDLNRVIVASCTPRTHEPLFRAACEEAGLNKYLFEMANIRDQCSWVHMHEPEKATEKAKDLVRMAVAKARLLQPQEEPIIDIAPSALVIGGGAAGMTAALCLANQGFKVYLVEKEPELGGMLRDLHKLYPAMEEASEVLNQLVNAVKSNENIETLTSTVVKDVKGFIGNFEATVQKGTGETVDFGIGTIVVATGADNFEPVGMYGYKEYDKVITQLQLEQLLKNGKLKNLQKVVMIQCVGAREEKGRTYCSRICCMTALKNALLIKELCPDADVYILFRDLQTYGEEYERYYREVQKKDVKFIKYLPEKPPEVSPGKNGKLNVNIYHTLIGEQVKIGADLVVLSTPLIQHEDAKELSQILKVPLGADGFFFEAHVKLRPVDFATDGIFVCGTAHSPKDIGESISQAYAVASRAAIPMAKGKVEVEAIVAVVNEELCKGCGRCEEVCEYNAIELEEAERTLIAKVIEAQCKGCGVCAVTCPTGAITMEHFTNKQINAMITAAIGG
ncbi:CoB--CoM heterodisulfide reductase iron-sulfur subunit A family protein [Candidatus Bathyarchaeota archaeon]|nr:CoB--CoM heterodisulfide reductase iron-sulfur subunit A family protein [Candidatus Bathyarchaeota archaeon]